MVDAQGCEIPPDSDGDGVIDSVDQCPNTAANTVVDALGCQPVPIEIQDSGGGSMNKFLLVGLFLMTIIRRFYR